MIKISELAKIEKNKLESDYPWILLFELTTKDNEKIRICRNTEDIYFDGYNWFAYPVSVGEFEETKKNSVSDLDIKIANINGILDADIDRHKGFVGGRINIHNLLVTDTEKHKEFTLSFKITAASLNSDFLNLTLSGFNPFQSKTPRASLRKLICRYKTFKGKRCGCIDPDATECNRTLKRCQELGNEANFGGAPTLGWKGVYV